MKERPILYSTPMIQAKLAGRKTQTRRIMRVQLSCDHSGYVEADWKDKPIQWSEIGLKHGKAYCSCCGNGVELSKDWSGLNCPYGKPGDILWARETWCSVSRADCVGGVTTKYHYKADLEDTFKWKPSIHMPKSASRIWERITDIRVERLQDISEEDAIAEGIEKFPEGYIFNNYLEDSVCHSAVESYRTLWESINGPGSWELSPWVWVLESEILSTTGRPSNL